MAYVPGLLALGLGVGAVVAGRAGDAPGVLLLGAAIVVGTLAVYARGARPLLVVLVGSAGVAAGMSDDAPGAVLLGLVLIAGALVWHVTRARRQPS